MQMVSLPNDGVAPASRGEASSKKKKPDAHFIKYKRKYRILKEIHDKFKTYINKLLLYPSHLPARLLY